jgi:hypothetical protein
MCGPKVIVNLRYTVLANPRQHTVQHTTFHPPCQQTWVSWYARPEGEVCRFCQHFRFTSLKLSFHDYDYECVHCHEAAPGLARTVYIRYKYNSFGREITKYTVIYGVYIRFWPTLGSTQSNTQHFTHLADKRGFPDSHVRKGQRTPIVNCQHLCSSSLELPLPMT